jgi:hypothetical protein
MSKLSLSGNVSGTGKVTLLAPDTDSDVVLNVPAVAGELDRLNRAGNLLQVVQTTLTPGGGVSISSGAGSTTVMSLAITPQSTASRILVCVSCHLEISNASAGSLSWGERILRGATEVYDSDEKWFFSGTTQQFEAWHVQYLDSPNTTSSTTYNFQITPSSGRGDIRFGRNGTTIMQLLEIAG